MRESAHLFGAEANLLGILTQPAEPGRRVGCLLFNAGVLHHIGPHRINVKLARALAGAGIAALRMDLSGLGDSGTGSADKTRDQQVLGDLGAGVQLLRDKTGVEQVAVIGICSGAVQAHQLALAETSVDAVLMFDGYVYPTVRTELISRWRHFRATPWSELPGKARQIATRLVRALRNRFRPEPSTTPAPGGASVLTRREFGASLSALVDRGVAVRIVYSGSFVELYNHPDQFRRAFRGARFVDRVECEYMPQVDHTFTSVASQQLFVRSTVAWAQRLAPPGADDKR